MSSLSRLSCTVSFVLAGITPLPLFAGFTPHPTQRPAEVSLGVGAYVVSDPGVGEEPDALGYAIFAHLSGAYAPDPYWTIAGSFRGGAGQLGGAEISLIHGLLEVRYVIERMSWRPWLAVGAGALYRAIQGTIGLHSVPRPEAVDLTLHAGAGMDVQVALGWSIGVLVRYHLVVTEPGGPNLGPFDISGQARFHF